MLDFLFDRALEVLERRIRQAVHVEQEIVEIDALGPTRRAGSMRAGSRGRWFCTGRHLVQRRLVMFVFGAMEVPARLPDQRWMDARYRIVLLAGVDLVV